MSVSNGSSGATSLGSHPGRAPNPTAVAEELADLVVDLQARGLRVEVPLERRTGGAGPSDSGFLWVGGFRSRSPPTTLRRVATGDVLAEDDGSPCSRAIDAARTRPPSNARASMT